MHKQIYQYMDSNVSTRFEDDDNTRWIAAASEQIADRYAEQHKWVRCGGRIFEQWAEMENQATTADYIKSGVDVVI